MDKIFLNKESWWDLFVLSAILVLILLFVYALNNIVERYNKNGVALRPLVLNKLFYKLKIVLEPVFAIIVIVNFININPLYHSVIVFLFIVLLFSQLRSYISGRLLAIKSSLEKNIKIKYKDKEGRIESLRNLGIILRVEDVRYRIKYYELIENGYAVLPTGKSSVAIQVYISNKNKEILTEKWIENFRMFLFEIPYLNPKLKPNIIPNYETNEIMLKVLLSEGSKEDSFIELLREKELNVRLKK